jgi:hypothetical protein
MVYLPVLPVRISFCTKKLILLYEIMKRRDMKLLTFTMSPKDTGIWKRCFQELNKTSEMGSRADVSALSEELPFW